MYANSRPVTSAQSDIHPHLVDLVARHARTTFRKPVLKHNHAAFEVAVEAWRNAGSGPIILDAGCGVGLSTLNLARSFPDHYVIGVDQSAHRLARQTRWSGVRPRNCIHVRADAVDFWRLMLESGIRPARQYLLYPNPWPKAGQLGRRWHGHPVFPTIVALGGELECRSNWSVYVHELAAALSQLSGLHVAAETYATHSPITPFEQKYVASGHTLWRCRASLP